MNFFKFCVFLYLNVENFSENWKMSILCSLMKKILHIHILTYIFNSDSQLHLKMNYEPYLNLYVVESTYFNRITLIALVFISFDLFHTFENIAIWIMHIENPFHPYFFSTLTRCRYFFFRYFFQSILIFVRDFFHEVLSKSYYKFYTFVECCSSLLLFVFLRFFSSFGSRNQYFCWSE